MRGWPRIPVAIRLAERAGLGRKEEEPPAGFTRFSQTEDDTLGILDVVALCIMCSVCFFIVSGNAPSARGSL